MSDLTLGEIAERIRMAMAEDLHIAPEDTPIEIAGNEFDHYLSGGPNVVLRHMERGHSEEVRRSYYRAKRLAVPSAILRICEDCFALPPSSVWKTWASGYSYSIGHCEHVEEKS